MNMHRFVAALTSCLAMCAPLSAGVHIADLAPRDAFVVVSIDSWSAVRAAYERTPLRDLWANERVRSFLIETFKETYGDPAEFFGELDPKPDTKDLSMPEGAMGAALFFEEDGEGGAAMRMLLVCDYAENAEHADEAWDWLDNVLDRLVAGRFVTREYSDHGEIEIATIAQIEAEPPVDDGMDEEEEEEDFWWMDDHEQGDSFLDEPMHLARVGNAMLVSTSVERLHDAIDRLRGVDLGQTLRDNKDYLDALAQHPPGSVAHGAVLLRSTRESLERLADGPMGDALAASLPMAWYFLDMVGPMMGPLGLDAVHAASVSLRLDTPDAIAEFGIAALAPEKRGVLALFDGPARPFTLPAFVGADATGVSVNRVNFGDIPRMVRAVIGAMPAEERGFMMEQAEFALAQIEPVLAVMQPELISVSRVERPFGAQSKSTVYAVPVVEAQTITDALTMFGQFAGLTPRDFQGNQIWEAEFVPVAIGVGSGHVFFGPAASIESALREAGAPDAPKLSSEQRFQRAAAALAREGVGFLYQETEPSIAFSAWVAANMDRMIEDQLRNFGLNPGDEYYNEFFESMRSQQPESMKKFPPPEDITRALGDTATELRSTGTGFVARWLLLRPQR